MTATTTRPPTRPVARFTAGFGNVFARESGLWWSTRRWWIQTLLWTGLLVGLLVAFLWIAEQAPPGPGGRQVMVGVAEVWPQYLPVAALLSTVGVVVLTHGVMLDERRSGTLEWVLTKPVSRTAFVLAKVTAHTIPVLLALIAVPWTGVYAVLSTKVDGVWPPGTFLPIAGLAALLVVFTVALTVLLGTWTTSRGLVIGVPIAAVMLYDGVHTIARDLAGQLPFPWETTTVAVQLATGAPLPSAVPIVATLAWTAAAIAAACWMFEHEQSEARSYKDALRRRTRSGSHTGESALSVVDRPSGVPAKLHGRPRSSSRLRTDRARLVTGLLTPPTLIISTYVVFQLSVASLGQRWGYLAGFIFFWLFWCVGFSLWAVGVDGIASVVRHARPRLPRPTALWTTLLAIPVAGGFGVALLPNLQHATVAVVAFALVIATVNATLEEVLWRGVYIHLFPDRLSLGWLYPAVMFALWHVSPTSVLGSTAVMVAGAG